MGIAFDEIQYMANEKNRHIIVGAITGELGKYYNTAVVFFPYKQKAFYYKRALWGWDKENFHVGNSTGIFEISGLKIGIRICFEIRFPELFRELYLQKTDLNVILFYDVSDSDDFERYELIKSHVRTRAVENVCPILCVDAIRPYQTAPTALYDRSGRVLVELARNKEALLIYELNDSQLSFGEQGICQITNLLIQKMI